MSDKLKVGQKGKKYDGTNLGKRDAFHVPGVLVTSMEKLEAGEGVCFLDGKTVAKAKSEKHGIVDPWVKGKIEPYVPFYVLVEPDLVDNFTHDFEIKGVKSVKEELAEQQTKYYYDEPDDGCRGCYS